jgi:hypothetical protein
VKNLNLSIAEAIAKAASTLNAPGTVEETLDAVVSTAPGTIPGFDHASISVGYRPGQVETRAASDDVVEKLDHIQYDAEEGPCYEAFTHPGLVAVPVMRHEQRWPRYIPHAIDAGVTAQMAVHLYDDGGGVRGSLNLYRTSGEGIDPEAPALATLFATHSALALGRTRVEYQLNTALGTSRGIGQAIGIVMERYQINEERAFAFLTRASSTSNIKLRDIASELVTQTDTLYTIRGT